MTTKAKIDRLRDKLLAWDVVYHNTGRSAVPDEERDAAEDLLRKLSPQDRYFSRVGAPVTGKNKVELPYVMPSLNKVRKGRGAEKWLERRASREITAGDKIDGTSLQIERRDGKLRAYTRGNGRIGRDVSAILPRLKNLGKLLEGESVRGEVAMPLAVFEAKYRDTEVNGRVYDDNRGLVNGTINAERNRVALDDVNFVAHGMLAPRLPWKKARVKLKSAGWTTAHTATFVDPTPDELEAHYATRKATSEYPLDGLVLEDGNPDNTVSFKIDAAGIPVVVRNVEWDISRYGVYKPTVWFEKPTRIGGVMVAKATGHNAAYIKSHGIGPGAHALVIRSGDTIPKIVGVTKKARAQWPTEYKWKDDVDIVPVALTNAEETRVLVKQLVETFKVVGVEGVKAANAEKLVEAGIDTLLEAVACSREDFEDAGLGPSLSGKLVTALKQAARKQTHVQLMIASHVWPRGFGEDKFTLILRNHTLQDVLAMGIRQSTARELGTIKGLSVTSATTFLRHLKAYVRWYKALGWKARKLPMPAAPVRGPLTGKSFVFTKIRDKQLMDEILKRGGVISNSVNKNTTAVVVRSKTESSGKSERALELNVPLFTIEEFRRKFQFKETT